MTPPEEWAEAAFPGNSFELVRNTFISHIRKMLADLEVTASSQENENGLGTATIVEGDALELDHFIDANSVSLIVSSPPYPNTMSYIDAYKLELWMGGFVAAYKDRQRLNHLSFRSHLQTPLHRQNDHNRIYPIELDSLIALMDEEALWHPGLPRMLRGYFRDMDSFLEKAFAVLKSGGQCVLVVGTSAYGNIIVLTDMLLAGMARERGFGVERIGIVRNLPTSSQQSFTLKPFRHYLRESILFLRKS